MHQVDNQTKRVHEERLRHAIELSLVPGVGSLVQNRLWQSSPALSEVFTWSRRELEGAGLAPDACDAVRSRRYRAMSEETMDWANRESCRVIIRGDAEYPEALAEIHDPPLLLYARGSPDVWRMPCVAVVGTRKPTCYGLQMAEGLARDLAERRIAIVSGLARGIDSAAHRGCLEANGVTVAVLGCGIDVVYPREHQHLTRKILERGVLVSEFPPGTSPAPQNFPVRNRIISGLSLGTVIVEASEYSGSLITARLAMEQNREVFAVPGNVTSPQSFGPNFLIKQGAKLLQNWRDVVEELPPEIRRQILSQEMVKPERMPELDLLSDEETGVLDLLETDQATQFDIVFRKSGLSIPRLSDLLLNLEMRGRIRQMPGNLYLKVARPGR